MIIYDYTKEETMPYKEIPKTFLPAKNLFNTLKNRFFKPDSRSRESLPDNILYYLSLMEFKDHIEEEVTTTEQKILEMFGEEQIETEYLQEYGLKVKLLKEYGKVFMVNKMEQSDVFEARRQKARRQAKK